MKNLLILTLLCGLCFGTLIGCGDEGTIQQVPEVSGVAAAPGVPGLNLDQVSGLDLTEIPAYIPTRLVVENDEAISTIFRDGRENIPRLEIRATQIPDEEDGTIRVHVTVVGNQNNTVYSNYPVRVGYPGHVHIWEYQTRLSVGHLRRDTFDGHIYMTGDLGFFTFEAWSKIGENARIELDVGGRTYYVMLINL